MTNKIRKLIRETIKETLDDQTSGPLSGGEKINVEIKQIDDSRMYNVFVNNNKIGEIKNKPNYHNDHIDSLLMDNAKELAKQKGVIPKHAAIRIGFVGDVNHIKND